MKLVHKSLTPCALVVCLLATCAIEPTTCFAQELIRFASFDPTKGFKPAQTNLTDIYLQMAASLECYGSPEPYIRHIQREHQRISFLYEQKSGKPLPNQMPSHMTESYMDKLVQNWTSLSQPLKLDALAKEAGRSVREAILGPRMTGTVVIEIFNHHQAELAKQMRDEPHAPCSFEQLQSQLSTMLAFDVSLPEMNGKKPERAEAIVAIVAQEKTLSATERKEYASLLSHDKFSKAEFTELDHFYSTAHDKLTATGKSEMSKRVWAGTHQAEPDHTRLDAINSAQVFRSELAATLARIDAVAKKEKAAVIKEVVTGVFIDLGTLAQAELAIAILESAITKR
ncbi:MAG: hypothetical protein JNM99_14690 [Verrucomicrobiaceae bacterium]|nr:hypothetical protein [Verrucomicrobiaceae bacterium]